MATTEQGKIVEVTARDLKRGLVDARAAEIRAALRGRDGYTTFWPRQRRKRGIPLRGKRSITQFTVRTRHAGPRSFIDVSQRTRHGAIIEIAETIRGHKNVHHRAGRRTIEANWDRISERASDNAERRAALRARRRARLA